MKYLRALLVKSGMSASQSPANTHKKIIIRCVAVIIIIVSVNLISLIFMPDYARRAIIHFGSGIEDYKFFENRVVAAGTPRPWGLSPDYNGKKIPARYLEQMEKLKTRAFLVIQNGEIISETYWGGHDEKFISNSFSMSKSIVGLLTGIALHDGKIKSLDQGVGDFLPEFRSRGKSGITIRHLLGMSSGIKWDENYYDPFGAAARSYFGSGLDSLVKGLDASEPPGKRFRYISINTQILGSVLEKAAGMSLSEYTSEKLWKPLGAQTRALWSLDDKDGVEKAFCCFNATARDFARIGALVLNRGNWNGVQLVPGEYIDAAIAPDPGLVDKDNNPVDYYGYQFWILHHKDMTIPYIRGIQGQYVFIIPKMNVVVVRIGKKRSSIVKNHAPEDSYMYIDAAFELMQ